MLMNYASVDTTSNYEAINEGTWCAKVEHANGTCTVLVWVNGLQSDLPCNSLNHANAVVNALQGKYLLVV